MTVLCNLEQLATITEASVASFISLAPRDKRDCEAQPQNNLFCNVIHADKHRSADLEGFRSAHFRGQRFSPDFRGLGANLITFLLVYIKAIAGEE